MYVCYVAWECDIYKSFDYSYVVRLIDVFEVDFDSFCIVLELCMGDDFDVWLKV